MYGTEKVKSHTKKGHRHRLGQSDNNDLLSRLEHIMVTQTSHRLF
jgi:hypothetical protein